jgi:hypothetical protein
MTGEARLSMNNGRTKDAGVRRTSADCRQLSSDRPNAGDHKGIAGNNLQSVVPCSIHHIIAPPTLIIAFTTISTYRRDQKSMVTSEEGSRIHLVNKDLLHPQRIRHRFP